MRQNLQFFDKTTGKCVSQNSSLYKHEKYVFEVSTVETLLRIQTIEIIIVIIDKYS